MSQPVQKILIIGPSWIGDMVMAQSLFKSLKEQSPDVQIDVLALAWTKPLLDRMPEVSKAIAMPVSHGVFGWSMRKKLGHELRSENYDQAIVLPNSWKSALIPWFANIPLRTGWRGEMRYGLLNDIRILDKVTLPLMVQRYVSLGYPASQAATPPAYPIPLMQAEAASYKLPAADKRLVLCPGAEFGPAKQWPTHYYAELAQHLINETWQVVILGSESDIETANAICRSVKTASDRTLINLCGKTELQQAIDLLATADTVVSNDSGLMHIAAALQTPLIAIYGPTSPDFTPPLAANATILQLDVDCGPCFQRECPEKHHKCMRQISSEQVLKLIKDNN